MESQVSSQANLKPNVPRSKSKKILGYFLIIAPFLGLVIIFISYAIASFVSNELSDMPLQNVNAENINTAATSVGLGTRDLREGVMSIVTVLLGFLGIICVIGIFVGLPFGIYLIAKGGEDKFSINDAVRFGWETMKKNFWFFTGIIIISVIIRLFPGIEKIATGDKKDLAAVYSIIGVVFWLIGLLVSFGWLNISLKFVDNKPTKISDLFPPFILFIKYLAGLVVYTLIIIGGMILLIIPGIIWSIKFSLYPYFILEGCGPIEAIKKSGQATQGAKSGLFALGLLLGAINFVGALALFFGLFATIPTTAVATAFAYRKLQSQMSVPITKIS